MKIKLSTDTGGYHVMVTPVRTHHCIPIKKGKYLLKLKVDDKSWGINVSNEGYLDVKHDSFLSFDDGGFAYANKIKESKMHKLGLQVKTACDGTFFVHYELIKVKKIGPDPFKKLLKEAKKFFKTHEYNEETSELYVDTFMNGVYYKEINDIIRKANLDDMKKMNNEIKEILGKLDKDKVTAPAVKKD